MTFDNNFKNKIFEKLEYTLLFIPILAVYLPTITYPVTKEIGNNVSFRPPGYVFAIVWPILLLLLGISWFVSRKMGYFINSVYILLIVLLSIWFILYTNNKYFGLIDIILCFLISLFLFFYNIKKFNKYASLPLLPLIFWLIFASILNMVSILNN